MGLRDMIRAIREYPAIHAELETARSELRQIRQELEQSEQKMSSLCFASYEQQKHTEFLSSKAEALRDALAEFCPKLSTPEDMKRFYDTISPSLDASGFTLYRMAKELTGIDVPSCFPYEDNRGLFEVMDGHQLLDWLTAVRFQAVEWDMIPNSTYESATLLGVDTSTPEYQAFEQQLYGKVLSRMGFENIVAPEQEAGAIESKVTELKLYSPLSAELVEEEPVRDWIDEPEPSMPLPLTGDDLSAPELRAAILKGIEDEQAPEETERGLMAYFDGSDAVNEKVVSFFPSVEEVDGRLYGVAVCQLKEALTPSEMAELKEYCSCQYADGWGEGYEQRPRRTSYGELYVSFWQAKDFFILTKEEMETSRVASRSPHQPKRGGDAR